MTDEMMNLGSLVEKTPDADLLREMIAFAAERLMEESAKAQRSGRNYAELTARNAALAVERRRQQRHKIG